MSAYDEGFNLFKREPTLMLAEVYWRAQACGYKNHEQHVYVDGYRIARLQHDNHQRERKTDG